MPLDTQVTLQDALRRPRRFHRDAKDPLKMPQVLIETHRDAKDTQVFIETHKNAPKDDPNTP